MKRTLFWGFSALAVCVVACGGSIAPGTRTAADVQASGLSQSFAGKHKCDAKSHDRPFIIDWDATDMSSFEARAADDVVFVKYEGCDLEIIDGCVDDSVKGKFGSYKPVQWTSGSLESLDINDEGDLYAKLPLGVSTLGGRVEGGEKFHMEYFVSGTRTATRDAVYRADLAKVAACKEATHFVYAYNLGAFALGAQSNIKGTVGGSAFGFGAGGDRSHSSKADKQGGVLASCRSDSAQEMDTCKVPIRLTLREIQDGQSPDAQAAQQPDTPAEMNLAGKLEAKTERQQEAADHAMAAQKKATVHDGNGCIAELNVHDRMDPRPNLLSTNVGSPLAALRGQCLMLAGKCEPGKVLYRKAYEQMVGANMDPSQIDRMVEVIAAQNCQGSGLSARDRILHATMALNQGLISKKDPSFCKQQIQTLKTLIPTTPPKGDDDNDILNAPYALRNIGVMCLVKAGDCADAFATYQDAITHLDYYKYLDDDKRNGAARGATMSPKIMRSSFEMMNHACKGKNY